MITNVTKDAMRVVINMNNPIMPVFNIPLRRVEKYKNDTCNINECVYNDTPITWGKLLEKDHFHFCYLLVNHVERDTEAFHALLMLLDFNDKVDIRMLKYIQEKDNHDDDDVILRHIQDTYSEPYRST